MKIVKITAIKQVEHKDLMVLYEQQMENACNISVGQVFYAIDAQKPVGLCESAWESMKYFVEQLALGNGHFFGNWMKNPYSAMISCNDGFRPVSFFIELIEEMDA